MTTHEVIINSPFIVSERLDGEVIAISNQSGKYYSLGFTASDIWYLMSEAVKPNE